MMWSGTMVARTLVAGLTAAGVLAGGAGVAVASAAMPTCTVTAVQLVGSKAAGGAVDIGLVGGFSGCMGGYAVIGITPQSLGYPSATMDNYAELAAVLKHWNSLDGVPAVSEWVNLSPTVAAGMKAAGVNPTMFLQWVNEYDGAGTVYHAAMPPTWPPFLPKALVSDPATIVGGTADQAVTAPKAIPPAQAAPQQPVTPTVAPKLAPASSTAAATTDGGKVTASQVTPASSTTSAAESATETTTAKSPKTVAVPTVTPVDPPAAVAAGGVVVPCVVTTTCRQAVVTHDRWLSTPWYRKAGLQIWWHRWWEVSGLAILAVATLGARAVITGRRNLAWYGSVRGPR